MKTGTKSVLFGVHAFWFHPLTVWLSWRRLYGEWPGFWETVAIFVHDIGYIGCEKMDDAKGKQHPLVGARLVAGFYRKAHAVLWHCDYLKALNREHQLFDLCKFHSRFLSAAEGREPSKLCWADKYCMKFDPAWFYLLRARLSGEIREYRANAADKIPLSWTDRQWYDWIQAKCIKHALNREKASHRQHSCTAAQ